MLLSRVYHFSAADLVSYSIVFLCNEQSSEPTWLGLRKRFNFVRIRDRQPSPRTRPKLLSRGASGVKKVAQIT